MHFRAFYVAAVAALALRLTIALIPDPSAVYPQWVSPGGDSFDYVAIAEGVARGEGFRHGDDLAYRPPGFPALLSAVYSLFGEGNQRAARLVLALVSTATLLTLSGLAREFFARRSAVLLTGLAVAIYPFLLYYAPLLLTETLFAFLLSLCVWLLVSWQKRAGSEARLVAAGVAAGIATLTRPSLLPFVGLSGLWIFKYGKRRTSAALYLVAAVVALAPWAVRNALVFDRFVPVSTNGPRNVVKGLTSSYLNELGIDTPFDTDSLLALSTVASELERHDQARDKALAFARSEPTTTARVTLQKAFVLWNPFSNRRGKVGLALNLGAYLPVLVLGTAGMVSLLRQHTSRPGAMLLLLLFASMTIVHAASIVNMRFRIPFLDPYLVVLAAGAVSGLSRRRSA